MKKIILPILFMACNIVLCAQSWSAFKGKTLYLATYGAYDPATKSCKNPMVCRFGEYMTFGTGGILTWNSRYGGVNSTYTYAIQGNRLILKQRSASRKIESDDSYIDIINIHGQYVLTRSSSGVFRIYSTQRQPVITGPGAEITSCIIEHNVFRNNQKGLVLHADIQFFRVSNHDLRVSAYFDMPDNNGLMDQNGLYRGYNGVVCTESSITNKGDDTFIKDLQLFLPYSELHLGNSGSFDVGCHVYVHDATLGGAGYYLTKTGFIHFNYNASSSYGSSVNGSAATGSTAAFWLLFGDLLW